MRRGKRMRRGRRMRKGRKMRRRGRKMRRGRRIFWTWYLVIIDSTCQLCLCNSSFANDGAI